MKLPFTTRRLLTAARSQLSLHAYLGSGLLALSALPGLATGQAQVMQTELHGDVLDGEIADLAIQSDATSAPQNKRGWIAQGFARAAIRISDGARMNAETTTFDAVTGTPEKPVALELDEARAYLYTVTNYALYREDVTTPSNPINRVSFDFSPAALNLTPKLLTTVTSSETLRDVRVIPFVGGVLSDSRVLVLTNYRLIVMRSDASGLSIVSQCLELYDQVAGGSYLQGVPDGHFNSLHINNFASVKVAIDSDSRTVAYLQANPGIMPLRTAQRAILMLCNLDAFHGFLAPTLNAGAPGPMQFAYWSPFTFPLPVPVTDEYAEARAIHDVTVRDSGGQTQVLAACGMNTQLKLLTATFAYGGVFPTATVTLNPLENLRQVTLDPIVANRLYVRGTSNFYVVDLTGTPTTLASITERANNLDRGDATIVRTLDVSGEHRTHWALCGNIEDYNLQAIDVTATTPLQVFGDGYIERCDGGVALDADNTYVGTMAGVRHYKRVNGFWEQAGYKPSSSDALSAFGGVFPEQIDLVKIGATYQILGASNGGPVRGLFAWPIHATTQDPKTGTFFDIPNSVFSSWNGEDVYVNDVVAFTAGTETYAALCPTRIGPPHPPAVAPWEVALVLFRWKASSGTWTLSAVARRAGPNFTFANSITIASLSSPNDKVAFVATDTGVMSFSLTQLTSATPVVTYVSEHYGGILHGIAVTPQHLIAAYTHDANNPRYVVYSWNQYTGQILTGLTPVFPASQVNAAIGETWKLRYDPLTSSTGDLYDCNGKGVFRLHYTASPLAITHLGTWVSQGAYITQDCRPYVFGGIKKLLVTKDDQAFAWVIP